MDEEEHIGRHKELHKKLDELLADYLSHSGKLISNTTLMQFLEWSAIQNKEPDHNA